MVILVEPPPPTLSSDAVIGGRRCCLRRAEVLAPMSTIVASDRRSHRGATNRQRWAPLLPTTGGGATTGGRHCCLWQVEVLPTAGCLRWVEALPPVSVIAACAGAEVELLPPVC
jgi:hypothetical protein